MEGKRTFKSQERNIPRDVGAKGPAAGEARVFKKDKAVRREELHEIKVEIEQKPTHKHCLRGYGQKFALYSHHYSYKKTEKSD